MAVHLKHPNHLRNATGNKNPVLAKNEIAAIYAKDKCFFYEKIRDKIQIGFCKLINIYTVYCNIRIALKKAFL